MMKFLPFCRVVSMAALVVFTAGATVQAVGVVPTNPPDQVSISAQVPMAYAAAGTPGSLRVVRTGSLLEDLTINYQVTGMAIAGQDYTALKGTRTIGASKDHVLITVHPLVNAGSSGTVKGVRVTLLPGDGYSLGTEVKATVKIVQ